MVVQSRCVESLDADSPSYHCDAARQREQVLRAARRCAFILTRASELLTTVVIRQARPQNHLSWLGVLRDWWNRE